MNPIEKDMVVVSLSPSYNKWKVIYKMLDEEGIKTEATIAKNQGYCILASLEDNICMCKEFRSIERKGFCNGRLYKKSYVDYVLYVKDECPRCKILLNALKKDGLTAITFGSGKDYIYPDEIKMLPTMQLPNGVFLDYAKAVKHIIERKKSDDV